MSSNLNNDSFKFITRWESVVLIIGAFERWLREINPDGQEKYLQGRFEDAIKLFDQPGKT